MCITKTRQRARCGETLVANMHLFFILHYNDWVRRLFLTEILIRQGKGNRRELAYGASW